MTTDSHSRPFFVGAAASIPDHCCAHGVLIDEHYGPTPRSLFRGHRHRPHNLRRGYPVSAFPSASGQAQCGLHASGAGTVLGALALDTYTLRSTCYPLMRDHAFARWPACHSALQALVPDAVYGILSASTFCIGAGIKIRSGVRPKSLAELRCSRP